MDIQSCLKGNHKLVVIYCAVGAYEIETVVRWCLVCGCVVVDEDYDGRTSPGAHTKMRSPQISKKAQ